MAPQWPAIKAVLHQALDLPQAARDAFVERACSGQPDLRREVESLLAAHEREGDGDRLQRIVDASRVHAARSVSNDDAQRTAMEDALGAEFEILGVLGHGGMGSVFLAHERALGRTVAIKMLRPDHASTAGGRERFRREARIAAGLSHPGIVPLHSFGESNGLWYFVMEHVRGQSLGQRMQAEGRLPLDEVQRILLAIADALSHAHRHGVIHRDIKPANILLDAEHGRPRLADFGISKLEGSSDNVTETGVIIGTPLYMSPEQARGDAELDPRSDIYSLGAVAYEMLTGRAPFTGNAGAVLVRRLSEDPTPILTVAPRVSPDLAHIVMRCLARERDERWADADALCAALRACTGGMATGPEELPQAVSDLSGFASYAIAWLGLGLTFASDIKEDGIRYLLIFIAVLVPVGLSMHLWRLRAYGLGLRRLLTIALRPPQWWGMWWPAVFRGPGDVWPQLPAITRVSRVVLSAFIILIPVVALLSDTGDSAAHTARDRAVLILVGSALVTNLLALAWVMRRGLDIGDAMQFLFTSTTMSAFWQEPRVARLLSRGGRLVRAPDPTDPADYARAFGELLRRCPAALAEVRDVASIAMAQQIAVITALSTERAMLGSEAGPAEEQRLLARLRLLEQGAQPTDDYRQLIASLREQLALLARLRSREPWLAEQQLSASKVLDNLWHELSSRASAARAGTTAPDETTLRIHALCRRILGPQQD
ncbi:MAG: serine/threonine-protein kinase [Gemmatimonadota bacterium]